MTRKGGAGRLFLIFMDDFLPFHGKEEASLITPLDFIASALLPTLTKAFGGDFWGNHAQALSSKLMEEGVRRTLHC